MGRIKSNIIMVSHAYLTGFASQTHSNEKVQNTGSSHNSRKQGKLSKLQVQKKYVARKLAGQHSTHL